MAELMEKASSWLSLLPRITMINLLEVAIISILVYEILFWVKNTRAWTVLKGLGSDSDICQCSPLCCT